MTPIEEIVPRLAHRLAARNKYSWPLIALALAFFGGWLVWWLR
jgi:hypothetical protein